MKDHVDVDIKIDDQKLQEILKKIKKEVGVKVGILGADGTKAVRGSDGKESDEKEKLTEATLGAIHEFGSEKRNIPARSFLHMPLQKKLKETLVKNSKFKSSVQRMNIDEINGHIGDTAVAIIHEAFETGGFGEWAQIKEETRKRKKGSDLILVDSGDLERSITYEGLKK